MGIMKLWQLREIPQDAFLSFDDDLKLKMLNQQFAFPSEHYDEVLDWLRNNMNNPYRIDADDPSSAHTWVKFVDETDFIAFKLRWS